MSEEVQEEKEKEEKTREPVKVSQLLGKQSDSLRPSAASIQEKIGAQIQNNQELYTTLSRSLLELHNDIRDFRKKGENMDRMIFSLQQGVNKMSSDISQRVIALENGLQQLTDLWNKAVTDAEATDKAIEEDNG